MGNLSINLMAVMLPRENSYRNRMMFQYASPRGSMGTRAMVTLLRARSLTTYKHTKNLVQLEKQIQTTELGTCTFLSAG